MRLGRSFTLRLNFFDHTHALWTPNHIRVKVEMPPVAFQTTEMTHALTHSLTYCKELCSVAGENDNYSE